VPAREGAAGDLAALEAWNASGGKPTRVGFARALSAPLELRYIASSFAARFGKRSGGGFLARRTNGNWVWGTSVEVGEAKALRLELAEVNLPAGTRFWAYSMGSESRSFDLRLLRDDRTLISPTIAGDRIYLEVELPAGALLEGQGLHIRRVYEIALDVDGESSASFVAPEADACLQNGECFDAGDFPGIANARTGVFRVLYEDGGFVYTCSGGLINDQDPTTLQPWLLTAHHCIDNQASALSMDTKFFWRFLSCGSGSSTFVYGPLGADLIVTSATTDVTLARAIDPTQIPSGATYLGWTSIRPPDGTALHRLSHPFHEGSGLTQPQHYSTHQSDDTPAFNCGGVFTPTNYLNSVNQLGTGISKGSSGSPVMLADGIIVGQLYGACGDDFPPDGCGTDEYILDGAFATSFPLLAPYLAPGAGGFCLRDADTACLLGGKFKVEVEWTTASNTGTGKVMAFNGERAESDESVFFWFFNSTNFEMGVKMVDACVAPFNRYWVFVSGLTSQQYLVRVTNMDTLEEKPYFNPLNNLPTTEGDTDAFTCP
jgi:lysyl endopeptidase